MIEVNRTGPFQSDVIPVTAASFPNLFVAVSDLQEGEVTLSRECEDGVYRSYRETTFSYDGARLLSLPPGNYRLNISVGPATVEVQQL